MKKDFGTALSREEMKKIIGGSQPPKSYCGSPEINGCCNVYCGARTNVTCSGTCGKCEDAGNGTGSKQGQDMICYQF
ncbi:MAG: hypothetical protein JST21_00440 [Bacteroidetes bacterium]|nr:hypothetical protein [Bacteroidota bacterium]